MYRKGFAQILTGTALAQAIMFLSTFVIGIYYSTEEIGIYGLFSSIIPILAIFSSFRLELAISKAKSDEAVANISRLIIVICGSFTIISIIIGLVYKASSLSVIEISIFSLILGVLALTGFNYASALASYHHHFSDLAKSKVVKALVFVCLIFVMSGIDNALIYAYAFSTFLFTFILLRKSSVLKRFKFDTLKSGFNDLTDYRYIYRYTVPNACLNVISQQMPIIAAGAIFSASTVGVYFFIDKILRTPTMVISQSIRPILIRYYSTNETKLTKFYFHAICLLITSLIYSVVAYFIYIWIAEYEFMTKWYDGTSFIFPILVIAGCQLTNTVSVPYLLVVEKTNELLNVEIVNIVLRSIVVLTVIYFKLASVYLFYGMASVSFIVLIYNMFVVFKTMKGLINEIS